MIRFVLTISAFSVDQCLSICYKSFIVEGYQTTFSVPVSDSLDLNNLHSKIPAVILFVSMHVHPAHQVPGSKNGLNV